MKTLERKLDKSVWKVKKLNWSLSSGEEENIREYCSYVWCKLMVRVLYNLELQKSQKKWYPANSFRKARDSDIQLIQAACEKSKRFIHNKIRVWKIQKIYSQQSTYIIIQEDNTYWNANTQALVIQFWGGAIWTKIVLFFLRLRFFPLGFP